MINLLKVSKKFYEQNIIYKMTKLIFTKRQKTKLFLMNNAFNIYLILFKILDPKI